MDSPRVGIIGAGQLGRMLALAAYPLGVRCRFLDRHPDAPGAQVGPIEIGELDDEEALIRLAEDCDVVTFEIENVSAAALVEISKRVPVHPSPAAVATAQDRLHEKALFGSLEIPTAAYVPIDSAEDLASAGARIGWPIVLKARQLGYDGRGQRLARSDEGLIEAWNALQQKPAIAEAWVDFSCEVSMLAARGLDGETVFYPLTENRHRDGILIESVAPFDAAALEQTARVWLGRIMEQFDYRGVLAVEFFVTEQGLVANEMAPRVHNSGHWTIEGSITSQFQNHIRTVLGLPAGSTSARGHAAMLNLLGTLPPRADLLRIDGLFLHEYGKEPRAQRKLGHCTLVDSDRASLMARLDEARRVLAEAGNGAA